MGVQNIIPGSTGKAREKPGSPPRRVSIFSMHCPQLSPLLARLPLQASSADVAIVAVGQLFLWLPPAPHPSQLPAVQSPSVNPVAGIRGLLGNNVWALDWPGDPGGLAPKLGTGIKLKRVGAKRMGGTAISRSKSRTEMRWILRQAALQTLVQDTVCSKWTLLLSMPGSTAPVTLELRNANSTLPGFKGGQQVKEGWRKKNSQLVQ